LTLNPNRRKSLLLLGADVLSVVAIFNLVTFLRGVTSQLYVWPLIAPTLVFVLSVHLIDGYGANSDMLSLDYASLHLIASLAAALATFVLTFVFIPAG